MSKKNPATGGGFPVTHFLAKKEENPNQKMKQQLEIKLKQQVNVKLTMILFGHVKKWRNGKTIFIFGKLWTVELLIIRLRKSLGYMMILKVKFLCAGYVENTPQNVIKTTK